MAFKLSGTISLFRHLIPYICYSILTKKVMTELVLKGKIDQEKLASIVNFLMSWGIDVEVKDTVSKKEDLVPPFAESFGMWAKHDIDIKDIRKMARERRTKTYGADSL